jgi:8-oxo-dGTP diphosphatase
MITRPGQILLIHRHHAHGEGTWSTPGGHLDLGEEPEVCAVREAFEETGIEVLEVRFRGITNDIFRVEGKHYITIWFEALNFRGEASLTAPDEMSELEWFSWDSLPSPLFLPLEHLLEGKCYPRPNN